MILQYIGKKPKLYFDAPWCLEGPYRFDPEVDEACCKVHPEDGKILVEGSPQTFLIVDPGLPVEPIVDPTEETDSLEDPEEGPAAEPDTAEVSSDPEVDAAAGGEGGDNQCIFCGQVFASPSGLKRHITVKHPELESA